MSIVVMKKSRFLLAKGKKGWNFLLCPYYHEMRLIYLKGG